MPKPPTCILCDAPAERVLGRYGPACIDHYQRTRTGGLTDAERAKLTGAPVQAAPSLPLPKVSDNDQTGE